MPGAWTAKISFMKKCEADVDRYAKFGTEHLTAAASRIESDRSSANVVQLSSYVFATMENRKTA